MLGKSAHIGLKEKDKTQNDSTIAAGQRTLIICEDLLMKILNQIKFGKKNLIHHLFDPTTEFLTNYTIMGGVLEKMLTLKVFSTLYLHSLQLTSL